MRVKLCFFVNVRKAKGLKVAGGSKIGSILDFDGAAETLKGLMGCAGVAKPGEEEGIGFKSAGLDGDRNKGAARGFSD